MLTDAQWAKMAPHCRGKESDPGRSGVDNRRFVEAVLWIARTGSPWRDLPAEFGPWNTVFKRFRDWVKADVFKRLFDAASDEPARLEWAGRAYTSPMAIYEAVLGIARGLSVSIASAQAELDNFVAETGASIIPITAGIRRS